MPGRDVENRKAVFGWPSCSKPLESITFMILDQPHPTSSRSVRRAYNMGSTVRSKKMALSEPAGRPPRGDGSHPGDARAVPVPQSTAGDLASQAGRGDTSRGCYARSDFRFNFQTAISVENRHSGAREARARLGIQTPSFRDGPQDQTSDVQLHIGESRDSGFDASHRPGMTAS